jgi:hypothetical protein
LFYTLPEAYIWIDWIKGMAGYRFGANRVSSGNFDNPVPVTDQGWVDLSYQQDGLLGNITKAPRDEPGPKLPGQKKQPKKPDFLPPDEPDSNLALKLEVKPANDEELDTMAPQFLDFPVAAVRSPPIHVETNNLIMISVLVKRVYPSAPGLGGIIVRDSIGGEQFQYRTSDPISRYSRVLLFRKAPADGTFTVTLGLAGYGQAYFDEFSVQVIEEDTGAAPPPTPDVAGGGRRGGSTRSPSPPTPASPQPPPPQWIRAARSGDRAMVDFSG